MGVEPCVREVVGTVVVWEVAESLIVRDCRKGKSSDNQSGGRITGPGNIEAEIRVDGAELVRVLWLFPTGTQINPAWINLVVRGHSK